MQSLEPSYNVSWTEVYSDFFLATEVLSACVPVRDITMAQLLGVTCVDVNATYLQSLSNGSQVTRLYLFLSIAHHHTGAS